MFIPVEAIKPADEKPPIWCSGNDAELLEARTRSEEVWNSWLKNSTRHGIKRGVPWNFTEAHEKVLVSQNRYFDCLEGLVFLK